MEKKKPKQYYFIMACIVLLSLLIVYLVGRSVYEFVSKTNESHRILAEFNEKYENDGIQIILFASPTCKWCKKLVPILDEIAEENDLKYYYLDVTKLFDNDYNEIISKLDIEIDGIPHLVVVKDKKVLGEQVGAETKENTIEFFKKYGVIEGDVEDEQSVSTSS